MPSLREVQERFAAALFDGEADSIATLIRVDGIDPGERLEVYRNNLREGFRKALALEYPVIERLVGEDYFRGLALELLAAHPSTRGDLHHVGAPFPAFLAERFAATEYAYFADVAALEWGYAEILIAPDAPIFDLGSLAGLPAECHAELRFQTAPASRLLESKYPVLSIWKANYTDHAAVPATAERIDLNAGPDRLLMIRTPAGVEFHALAPAEFAFACAFAQAATLETAFEAARSVDADFDPGVALRHLVTLGFLVAAAHPALEHP